MTVDNKLLTIGNGLTKLMAISEDYEEYGYNALAPVAKEMEKQGLPYFESLDALEAIHAYVKGYSFTPTERKIGIDDYIALSDIIDKGTDDPRLKQIFCDIAQDIVKKD